MANLPDQLSFSEEDASGKMTPESLRRYPGCEHYDDEQANEIIDAIEKLAIILLDITIPPNNLPKNKDEDLLGD